MTHCFWQILTPDELLILMELVVETNDGSPVHEQEGALAALRLVSHEWRDWVQRSCARGMQRMMTSRTRRRAACVAMEKASEDERALQWRALQWRIFAEQIHRARVKAKWNSILYSSHCNREWIGTIAMRSVLRRRHKESHFRLLGIQLPLSRKEVGLVEVALRQMEYGNDEFTFGQALVTSRYLARVTRCIAPSPPHRTGSGSGRSSYRTGGGSPQGDANTPADAHPPSPPTSPPASPDVSPPQSDDGGEDDEGLVPSASPSSTTASPLMSSLASILAACVAVLPRLDPRRMRRRSPLVLPPPSPTLSPPNSPPAWPSTPPTSPTASPAQTEPSPAAPMPMVHMCVDAWSHSEWMNATEQWEARQVLGPSRQRSLRDRQLLAERFAARIEAQRDRQRRFTGQYTIEALTDLGAALPVSLWRSTGERTVVLPLYDAVPSASSSSSPPAPNEATPLPAAQATASASSSNMTYHDYVEYMQSVENHNDIDPKTGVPVDVSHLFTAHLDSSSDEEAGSDAELQRDTPGMTAAARPWRIDAHLDDNRATPPPPHSSPPMSPPSSPPALPNISPPHSDDETGDNDVPAPARVRYRYGRSANLYDSPERLSFGALNSELQFHCECPNCPNLCQPDRHSGACALTCSRACRNGRTLDPVLRLCPVQGCYNLCRHDLDTDVTYPFCDAHSQRWTPGDDAHDVAECVTAFSFMSSPRDNRAQCAAAPSPLSSFGVCPKSRGPHSLYITLCGLCRKSVFVACDACRVRFFCTECAVIETEEQLAMRRFVAGIPSPPPPSPPSSPPASRLSPPSSPPASSPVSLPRIPQAIQALPRCPIDARGLHDFLVGDCPCGTGTFRWCVYADCGYGDNDHMCSTPWNVWHSTERHITEGSTSSKPTECDVEPETVASVPPVSVHVDSWSHAQFLSAADQYETLGDRFGKQIERSVQDRQLLADQFAKSIEAHRHRKRRYTGVHSPDALRRFAACLPLSLLSSSGERTIILPLDNAGRYHILVPKRGPEHEGAFARAPSL